MAHETQLLWSIFLGIGAVKTIEETLAEKVAPGARGVAGHLAATSRAAADLESELDAIVRS